MKIAIWARRPFDTWTHISLMSGYTLGTVATPTVEKDGKILLKIKLFELHTIPKRPLEMIQTASLGLHVPSGTMAQ